MTFEGADGVMFLDLDSVSLGDNLLWLHILSFILLHMCVLSNENMADFVYAIENYRDKV